MANPGAFLSEARIPVRLCVGDAEWELGTLGVVFAATPGADVRSLRLEVVHERLTADLADLLREAVERIEAG